MAQLTLLDKIQPLLLILSVFLGLLLYSVLPTLASISVLVVQVGIFSLIVLIMSGKSLSEISRGFTKSERLILISVLLNFVFTPLFAWLLAGGDVETGIVLLGVNIVLQLSLLPVYAYLFLRVLIPFSFTDLIKNIVEYLLIPLGLSRIARRAVYNTRSPVSPRIISYSKTFLLMVVITFMFLSQAERLYSNMHVLLKVVIPVLIFFSLIPLVDLTIAKATGITYKEYALLTFTTTARNSEVSLAIAATVFPGTLAPLVVAIAPAIELPLLILILKELELMREIFFK